MKWHQPFKRPVYAAIASTLALSLGIGAVHAQESVAVARRKAATSGSSSCRERRSPTARALAAVRNEKAAFRQAAAAAGVQFQGAPFFRRAVQRFSRRSQPSQSRQARQGSGREGLYPVEIIAAPSSRARRPPSRRTSWPRSIRPARALAQNARPERQGRQGRHRRHRHRHRPSRVRRRRRAGRNWLPNCASRRMAMTSSVTLTTQAARARRQTGHPCRTPIRTTAAVTARTSPASSAAMAAASRASRLA